MFLRSLFACALILLCFVTFAVAGTSCPRLKSTECDCPRKKSTECDQTNPLYSFFDKGRQTFRFKIVNLATGNVSRSHLTKCLAAIEKDTRINFFEDWDRQASIQYSHSSELQTDSFWDGTSIPLFVTADPSFPNSYGFHSTQSDPTITNSWWNSGYDLNSTTGINPRSNFPLSTPFIFVSWTSVVRGIKTLLNDPYSIKDPLQLLCSVISHEIHETLGNDQLQRYHYFDNTAPFIKDVKIVEVEEDGTVIPGTKDANGHYKLQKLTDVFPYFFASTIAEAGDAVNRGGLGLINSYLVDGWRMANYPTPEFFNCFYRGEKRFDHNGFVKVPCNPYGGLHEIIYLTDLNTGLTWLGEMNNLGPLTGNLSESIYGQGINFPPNTTYFQLFGNTSYIGPGLIAGNAMRGTNAMRGGQAQRGATVSTSRKNLHVHVF